MTEYLTGRKIVGVRALTKAEINHLDWPAIPRQQPGAILTEYIALDLDDGSTLFASQDTEGNGPACLFRHAKGKLTNYVVHLVQG